MSLLDSDAEELKNRNSQNTSSGRKTNQSGLGALKSLSKYSNLTAKYRKTSDSDKKETPEPKQQNVVEHSRGTFSDTDSKSVQSQGNPALTSENVDNNQQDSGANKVSAKSHGLSQDGDQGKSVQSQGNPALTSEEINFKQHVNEIAKVSANVHGLSQNGDQSKSVQSQGILAPTSGDNKIKQSIITNNITHDENNESLSKITDDTNDCKQLEISPKEAPNLIYEDYSQCKVSATQTEIAEENNQLISKKRINFSDNLFENNLVITPPDSPSKVSANAHGLSLNEDQSKSGQSQGNSALTLDQYANNGLNKFDDNVSAKSHPLSYNGPSNPEMESQGNPALTSNLQSNDSHSEQKNKVSAKPHGLSTQQVNNDAQIKKENVKTIEVSAGMHPLQDFETKNITVNENNQNIAKNQKTTNLSFESRSIDPLIKSKVQLKDKFEAQGLNNLKEPVKADSQINSSLINNDNVNMKTDPTKLTPQSGVNLTMNQNSTINSVNNETSQIVKIKVSAEVGAKSGHNESKVSANSVQSQGKVGSEVSAKIRVSDLEMLLPNESALTLFGSQKSVLDFIYDQCVWNQGLITGPITKHQLIEATKLNEETALSAIKRLRKKGIIDRYSYKDGKAGWTKYRLAELSYKEILSFRQNYQSSYFLAQQSQGKVSAVVSANAPSKIDSNNNISNYTSAPTLMVTWFKHLNFTPVHPINAMQVNSSIRRVVEEKLEQDDVQNFINRFMPWLSTQGKVNSPIAIFCDKLKEYANEGDSAILYVQTQEEIQAEAEIAQKAEKLRLEMELIQKAREYEKSQKLDQEFESWYNNATDEELISLQEPNSLIKFKGEIYKHTMRGIYAEKFKNDEI